MTLTRYDLESVMMSYLNNLKPELSGVVISLKPIITCEVSNIFVVMISL